MTYDYKCNDCGNKFSVKQSLKEHEDKKVHCPHCGSAKTTHLMERFFAKTARKS